VCVVCRLAHVTPGHSNRVFSLNFNPDDDNIILTGGWDNTVQIWDVRVSHAVRLIYGPHIAGDSVDIHGGVVLTGSWRPEHQLEVPAVVVIAVYFDC
jgi:COMPASS component SWD3